MADHFIIIKSCITNDVQKEVNAKLSAGYKLHGPLISHGIDLIQAMVLDPNDLTIPRKEER
jgi:hypothetical protein